MFKIDWLMIKVLFLFAIPLFTGRLFSEPIDILSWIIFVIGYGLTITIWMWLLRNSFDQLKLEKEQQNVH